MTMKRLVGGHCVQRGNSETEGSKLLGKGRDAGVGGVRRSSLPTGVIQDKGKLERVRERCTEVD